MSERLIAVKSGVLRLCVRSARNRARSSVCIDTWNANRNTTRCECWQGPCGNAQLTFHLHPFAFSHQHLKIAPVRLCHSTRHLAAHSAEVPVCLPRIGTMMLSPARSHGSHRLVAPGATGTVHTRPVFHNFCKYAAKMSVHPYAGTAPTYSLWTAVQQQDGGAPHTEMGTIGNR